MDQVWVALKPPCERGSNSQLQWMFAGQRSGSGATRLFSKPCIQRRMHVCSEGKPADSRTSCQGGVGVESGVASSSMTAVNKTVKSYRRSQQQQQQKQQAAMRTAMPNRLEHKAAKFLRPKASAWRKGKGVALPTGVMAAAEECASTLAAALSMPPAVLLSSYPLPDPDLSTLSAAIAPYRAWLLQKNDHFRSFLEALQRKEQGWALALVAFFVLFSTRSIHSAVPFGSGSFSSSSGSFPSSTPALPIKHRSALNKFHIGDLLKTVLVFGQFEIAKAFLRCCLEDGMQSAAVLNNIFLTALCRSGQVDKAVAFFREVQEQEKKVNNGQAGFLGSYKYSQETSPGSWTNLKNGSEIGAGGWDEGGQLGSKLAEGSTSGIEGAGQPSAQCQLDGAERNAQSFVRRSMSGVVAAAPDRVFGQRKDFLDAVSFSILIGGLAETGRWAEAEEIFRGMGAAGRDATVTVHVKLLEAYQKGRQWQRCLQQLKVVRDFCEAKLAEGKEDARNLRESLEFAYVACMRGVAEGGEEWGVVRELFWEMTERRDIIAVKIETVNDFLSLCKNQKQAADALAAFDWLESSHTGHISVVNPIVRSSESQSSSAKAAPADVPPSPTPSHPPLMPTIVTINTAMGALRAGGQPKAAAQVFLSIWAEEVFHDQDAASSVSGESNQMESRIKGDTKMSRCKELRGGRNVRDRRGLRPNAITITEAICSLSESGDSSGALNIFWWACGEGSGRRGDETKTASKLEAERVDADMERADFSCDLEAEREKGGGMRDDRGKRQELAELAVGNGQRQVQSTGNESLLGATRGRRGWARPSVFLPLVLDVGVCNAALMACCRDGRWWEAERVFKTMQRKRILPDSTSFVLMMSAASRARRVKRAEHLFGEMRRKGMKITLGATNAMMDAYANEGNFLSARETFEALPDWGLQPDVVSYTSLLKAIGQRLKKIEAAKNQNDIVNSLPLANPMSGSWPPSLGTISDLVYEEGDPSPVVYQDEQMQKSEQPGVDIFAPQLDVSGSKNGSYSRRQVQLPSSSGRRPFLEKAPLQAQERGDGEELLAKPAAMEDEREGCGKLATALFDEMRSRGIEPTAQTFSVYLPILAALGLASEATLAFSLLRSLGLLARNTNGRHLPITAAHLSSPGVFVTDNSRLKPKPFGASASSSKPTPTVTSAAVPSSPSPSSIPSIRRENFATPPLPPASSAASWGGMVIRACVAAGDVDKAAEIVRIAKVEAIRLSEPTVWRVLRLCEVTGRWQEAISVLESYEVMLQLEPSRSKRTKGPEQQSNQPFSRPSITAPETKDSLTAPDMKKGSNDDFFTKRSKVSSQMYGSVISACDAAHNVQEAFEFYKKMLKNSIQPTMGTNALMVNMLRGEGMWLQAMEVYNSIVVSS